MLPSLSPLTRLVEPHCFGNVALFQKGSRFRLCYVYGCSCSRSCSRSRSRSRGRSRGRSRCCCRLSAPLEPSTKSLSNGLEILLFERGEPRASYKISRLKVIFVAPWHRAGAPLSLPVSTIPGATLFAHGRALALPSLVLFLASEKGPLPGGGTLCPLARLIEPHYFRTVALLRNGPLAGGWAFQAGELCLGQGFAKHGAYANREQSRG